MTDTLLDAITRFSTTLTFGDLPPNAIDAARQRLVDSAGCGIGAYDCDTARVSLSVACPPARAELAGRILGSKRVAAADTAAFVNTCMIRNLDLNDILQGGHPSDCLGALFAVAPQVGASGARLITAMVVAYETIIRLTQGGMRDKGWDQGLGISVGTVGGLCNLLRLSPEATRHAIAITAVGNTPLRATRSGQLSMWKGAATAYAVRNAVFGVQLAAAGMTGPEAPFTGRHGLFEQITGPFEITPFGTRPEDFLIPSIYLKYWPVAYSLSPVIWAGIALRKQVDPAELVSLEVNTYEFSVMESGSEPGKWDPQTRETADHSIPYVLARALLHDVVDEEAFQPAAYLDTTIRPLMNRIKVRADAAIEQEIQQGTVHVRLCASDRSGKSYEVNIVNPIGHAKNPFTPKDLEAKFRRLCEPRLGKRRATRALQLWQALDTADDLKPAFDALVVRAPRHNN